jgi:23S rRNA pseudouridine1911/1915/1917 synthase
VIGRGRDLSLQRDHIHLVVRTTEAPRLDQFLIDNLAWKSRTRVQKLIRLGAVTVNAEVAKPSRKVRAGDDVCIQLSPGAPRDDDLRSVEIVYEDLWLLAVNKPAGLLVHPVGRHVYDTLINYLHRRHRSAGGAADFVPRLCHRIDKNTTGLVVVAKDSDVLREVSMQFESREVTKEYVALVTGIFPDDRRSIDIPIGEGTSLPAALEHSVLREARTLVAVERRFHRHTLLRCNPLTGRQNQIRIHLAAAGYPIAGDKRFGGVVEKDLPPRYLLHAERVLFFHPCLKCDIELSAPWPADFRQLVERLEAGS